MPVEVIDKRTKKHSDQKAQAKKNAAKAFGPIYTGDQISKSELEQRQKEAYDHARKKGAVLERHVFNAECSCALCGYPLSEHDYAFIPQGKSPPKVSYNRCIKLKQDLARGMMTYEHWVPRDSDQQHIMDVIEKALQGVSKDDYYVDIPVCHGSCGSTISNFANLWKGVIDARRSFGVLGDKP